PFVLHSCLASSWMMNEANYGRAGRAGQYDGRLGSLRLRACTGRPAATEPSNYLYFNPVRSRIDCRIGDPCRRPEYHGVGARCHKWKLTYTRTKPGRL